MSAATLSDAEYSAYRTWLASLTDSELDNERYTVTREWRLIGMPEAVAAEKAAACSDDLARRTQLFLGAA